MSNITNKIKSLRIKTCEQEMLALWMKDNLPHMDAQMTQTEVLHHFIYMGLCRAKVDSNGNLHLGKI